MVQSDIVRMDIPSKCPKCEGTEIIKSGKKIKSGGPVQMYQCKTCGHKFYKK